MNKVDRSHTGRSGSRNSSSMGNEERGMREGSMKYDNISGNFMKTTIAFRFWWYDGRARASRVISRKQGNCKKGGEEDRGGGDYENRIDATNRKMNGSSSEGGYK